MHVGELGGKFIGMNALVKAGAHADGADRWVIKGVAALVVLSLVFLFWVSNSHAAAPCNRFARQLVRSSPLLCVIPYGPGSWYHELLDPGFGPKASIDCFTDECASKVAFSVRYRSNTLCFADEQVSSSADFFEYSLIGGSALWEGRNADPSLGHTLSEKSDPSFRTFLAPTSALPT